MALMKPKILIVVDVPGWALDRTAKNVVRCLSSRYSFTIVYNNELLETLSRHRFDLYYPCYWRQLIDCGLSEQLPSPRITGVRSHFKWDEGKGKAPSGDTLSTLGQYSAINVSSQILFDIFSPHIGRLFHTPHGVDCSVFTPPNRKKHSPAGKLRIGWAGSKSNHPGKRGLYDYLLPALKDLDGVELVEAAREEKWRRQEEMVVYYGGLDAYVCTSRTEGGPHPLLEASACGVPLVSTKVGHAPELIIESENGFLVEREVEDIRSAIKRLRDDRELRIEMGRKARETVVEAWNWEKQAQHYIPFFDEALKV